MEIRGIKVQGQAGPNSEFECSLRCISRSCLETCLETTEWLSFLCLSISIHILRGNTLYPKSKWSLSDLYLPGAQDLISMDTIGRQRGTEGLPQALHQASHDRKGPNFPIKTPEEGLILGSLQRFSEQIFTTKWIGCEPEGLKRDSGRSCLRC